MSPATDRLIDDCLLGGSCFVLGAIFAMIVGKLSEAFDSNGGQ